MMSSGLSPAYTRSTARIRISSRVLLSRDRASRRAMPHYTRCIPTYGRINTSHQAELSGGVQPHHDGISRESHKQVPRTVNGNTLEGRQVGRDAGNIPAAARNGLDGVVLPAAGTCHYQLEGHEEQHPGHRHGFLQQTISRTDSHDARGPRSAHWKMVDRTASESASLRSKHFNYRSEERRVGKECRSRWSPY